MTRSVIILVFVFASFQLSIAQSADSCTCWLERDTSWQVVPFINGAPPEYRNDDGNSPPVNIPFSFNYYNATISQIYINNNGNISFLSPLTTYTPATFPNTSYYLIAPFWGDVDTRSPLSGVVYYVVKPDYIAVQWDGVGYYTTHDNLLNHFQLIISDGNSSVIRGGNVSFCYKDMQWTTGDASNGFGGFGGFPASVVANSANGNDYVLAGLFDQPGLSYDGPNGFHDGIDHLDNRHLIFDLSQSTVFAPLVFTNYSCDTLDICLNDTLNYQADFYTTNNAATINISVDSMIDGLSIISQTSGQIARTELQFIPASTGIFQFGITGTTSLNPPASTQTTIILNVINCLTMTGDLVADDYKIYPNPAKNKINYSCKNCSMTEIFLSDLNGKVIKHVFAEEVIDISDIEPGIYFVRIIDGPSTFVRRIIKAE